MNADKRNNRRKSGPPKGFVMLVLIVVVVLLVGYLVMLLWNTILTDVLAVNSLNYWQALGILLLSRILFGRWGAPNYKGKKGFSKRHRWKEKWMNMSEEERMQFKAKWRQKCGDKPTKQEEEE